MFIDRFRLLLVVFVSMLFTACWEKEKEGNNPVNAGKIAISLAIVVDSFPLQYNQYSFQDPTQNNYSISNIEYYLSDIRLHQKAGNNTLTLRSYVYVNASTNRTFSIEGIEPGTYDQLSFVFGIDSAHNYHGGIDNTVVNEDMQWPNTLGGGYHFMRFEGRYKENGNSTTHAYAIHTGKTPHQVKIALSIPDVVIEKGSSKELKLRFNLAEILRHPHAIDLSSLPGTIMNNDSIQSLIQDNLQDAFSIQ